MSVFVLGVMLPLFVVSVSGDCLVENTTAVICSSQEYQTIPERFPRSIKTLALPQNNISELTKHSLLKYKDILELNLNYNRISSTQSMAGVSILKHLRVLCISGNDLQVLDFYEFSSNARLEEFYADNNGQVQINDKRVNLLKLRIVSLNDNNLEGFPLEAFKGFSNIEVLSLQNNKLETLPEDLHTILKKLKQLLLSGNPIKHLSTELQLKSDLLGKATSTVTLAEDTSKNVDLTKRRCLRNDSESVICTSQEYEEVPTNFLSSIRILNLQANKISSLNETTLKMYTNIVDLNLNQNCIRSTSNLEGIGVLKKLQVLHLSENGLLVLDLRIFSRNIHLKAICADGNPDMRITESPVNLHHMKIISLAGNKLTKFPAEALKNFRQLQFLNLSNNELTVIPENIMQTFPHLKQLLLSNNPLTTLNSSQIPITDLNVGNQSHSTSNLNESNSNVSLLNTKINESRLEAPDITTKTLVNIQNSQIFKNTTSNFTVEKQAAKNMGIPVNSEPETGDSNMSNERFIYMSVIIMLLAILLGLMYSMYRRRFNGKYHLITANV